MLAGITVIFKLFVLYYDCPRNNLFMTSKEFEEIAQRYLKGECTPEERQWVEKWYDAIGEETAEELIKEKGPLRDKLWAQLNMEIQEAAPLPTKRFNYRRLIRVAAAVVVLAISTYIAIYLSGSHRGNIISTTAIPAHFASIANNGTAVRKVALSDGSVVLLQPGSEISFPEKFTDDKREVYFTGEAFFEIAKDAAHPFFVYAGEVTTRVLGTSFNVKAYNDDKEIVVAVRTGRVSVMAKTGTNETSQQNKQEVILTPNQQAVFTKDAGRSLTRGLVEIPQVVVPHASLQMTYRETPVVEIFEVLKKNYGVEIQYDRKLLSTCTLTTDLSDEGLYERIEIICQAIGASYRVENTLIIIEGTNCK